VFQCDLKGLHPALVPDVSRRSFRRFTESEGLSTKCEKTYQVFLFFFADAYHA
jgi:hypothetical protein